MRSAEKYVDQVPIEVMKAMSCAVMTEAADNGL